MDINEALEDVTFLFLDTAPVIYFVEQHPVYFSIVNTIFDRIDQGGITAVTSPITLAEGLIIPYKTGALHPTAEFLGIGDNSPTYAIFPNRCRYGEKGCALACRI